MKKNNIESLNEMKNRGEKISQITCYDYSTARIFEEAGVNSILVGDSLGMTMQGYEDTLPVTMDEMIVYGRSVGRACKDTFVVVDMLSDLGRAGSRERWTDNERMPRQRREA